MTHPRLAGLRALIDSRAGPPGRGGRGRPWTRGSAAPLPRRSAAYARRSPTTSRWAAAGTCAAAASPPSGSPGPVACPGPTPWPAGSPARIYGPGDDVAAAHRSAGAAGPHVPWLPELTRRLAARLPSDRWDDDRWRLVAELVTATGCRGSSFRPATGSCWAGRGRSDPTGGSPTPWPPTPSSMPWPRTCSRWTGSVGCSPGPPPPGCVRRPAGRWPWPPWPRPAGWTGRLLDRCLGRLLRGGPAAELRGFLLLHEALDPTWSRWRPGQATTPGSWPTGPPGSHRPPSGRCGAWTTRVGWSRTGWWRGAGRCCSAPRSSSSAPSCPGWTPRPAASRSAPVSCWTPSRSPSPRNRPSCRPGRCRWCCATPATPMRRPGPSCWLRPPHSPPTWPSGSPRLWAPSCRSIGRRHRRPCWRRRRGSCHRRSARPPNWPRSWPRCWRATRRSNRWRWNGCWPPWSPSPDATGPPWPTASTRCWPATASSPGCPPTPSQLSPFLNEYQQLSWAVLAAVTPPAKRTLLRGFMKAVWGASERRWRPGLAGGPRAAARFAVPAARDRRRARAALLAAAAGGHPHRRQWPAGPWRAGGQAGAGRGRRLGTLGARPATGPAAPAPRPRPGGHRPRPAAPDPGRPATVRLAGATAGWPTPR